MSSRKNKFFLTEVRVKRLLSSVGLWYIASYIPTLLLLFWGWRMQRTARLASKNECPKGNEPISVTQDTFVIFGVARDCVLRYHVAEVGFEYEARENRPRVDVVFSGCRDAKRRVFRRAVIVVRGSADDYVKLKQRVDALEAA